MTTSFITTAIPYVNARPHLGFAYELVLADILARHRRLRGRDVRFVTGTDDNSLKNVVAAEREGVSPRELVDRLSRWREPVRDAIATGRLAILPEAARAETLAFLDGEVRDLSVSRVADRARGWGIPVPGDPSQVIYVWFDALANYLASLGLGGDEQLLDLYWRGGGERVHVIGKGITRFHAVYWPAFLLAAGLPLPDAIYVHGYLTVDGAKISKSGRNVEVGPVVEQCGTDALRWYFARACRTRADADVSIDAICDAYDRDLADRLGNLVQRCTTLAAKLTGGRVPAPSDTPPARELVVLADELPARVDAALDAFAPDEATAAIVGVLDFANSYLERTEPWRIARADPAAAASALYAPLHAAGVVARELRSFAPDIAATIAGRIGELQPGAELRVGPPPLPRKRVRVRP